MFTIVPSDNMLFPSSATEPDIGLPFMPIVFVIKNSDISRPGLSLSLGANSSFTGVPSTALRWCQTSQVSTSIVQPYTVYMVCMHSFRGVIDNSMHIYGNSLPISTTASRRVPMLVDFPFPLNQKIIVSIVNYRLIVFTPNTQLDIFCHSPPYKKPPSGSSPKSGYIQMRRDELRL